MSDIAIRVENLSKCYRIGLKEKMHDTFIGALTDFVRKPVENFRRLRKLTRFDDEGEDIIWALKNVSFEVKRGEVVGIIGPNGAGKTTLLKVLSRITEPTSGRAVVNGRVGSLLEVGTGMHPELTGRENIYLSGTILGMTKAEIDRKFDEIVEFAELSKFIDTPVKRYSSGMKVRLGFAIAAHLEPEILLVDEVLAVGDVSFQRKCLGRMSEVAGEGRTVLFVSHNLAAIESLCLTVFYLNSGYLIAKGTKEVVINNYLATLTQEISSCSIDLDNHPRRVSNMQPILRKLELRNRHGELSNTFKVGDTMIIDVTVHPHGNTFGSPRISINISNHLGVQVCKVPSWAKKLRWKNLRDLTTLRFVILDNVFAPGKYYLSLSFGDGSLVDRIDYAATFNIVAGDIYETGKLGGGIFIPHFECLILPKSVGYEDHRDVFVRD